MVNLEVAYGVSEKSFHLNLMNCCLNCFKRNWIVSVLFKHKLQKSLVQIKNDIHNGTSTYSFLLSFQLPPQIQNPYAAETDNQRIDNRYYSKSYKTYRTMSNYRTMNDSRSKKSQDGGIDRLFLSKPCSKHKHIVESTFSCAGTSH